jgi:hypothetical protein
MELETIEVYENRAAKKRSNNNSAFEEFFYTEAVGVAFNPFAIYWKKYMKMFKAPYT